jgi:hypothetical protein
MISPETRIIHNFLEHLFGKAREEYPQGLIEIRYGKGTKLNNTALFGNNPKQVEEAAKFAADINADGHNVYVGVNPRKPNTKGFPSDTDVEIAFWQFADLDRSDALAAAGSKMVDCPPTMTVTTGTIPTRRAHLYWELEDPVRNLDEWTTRQRGVADRLDGDSVINPSRVMRLAGTVAYPPQKKMERGYAIEVSSFRTDFPDERTPVAPQVFARAYPAQPMPPAQTDVVIQPTELRNNLQAMVQRPNDVNTLIAACQAGDQWHNHMIRLVASLATNGRTDTEILALAHEITLPGYSIDDTRREMHVALMGARRKYATPEPVAADLVDPDAIFELFDIDEIEAMPPPTWLIHEMLVEDGLTILYGDPGAGKSFISLDMGLRLAHGMDWHGKATKPTGVLYIAGEGVRGIGKRIKGWRMKHGMEGVEAPFLLLPVAVEILDEVQRGKLLRTIDAAVQRAGFHIGLIQIDTVSRALSGADENGQEAMGQFVKACDAIRRHANASVLGVHHSGKDKDKGMRGSTVLLGACDASIRVSKTEKIVVLKTEKQKDAEEAEPIYMEMETMRWAAGLEEEQTTLVPVLKEGAVQSEGSETLSRDQIRKAFGLIADAWGEGKPLSMAIQTRKIGRYAPSVLGKAVGCRGKTMEDFLVSWIENKMLEVDMCDHRNKVKGLRILELPE